MLSKKYDKKHVTDKLIFFINDNLKANKKAHKNCKMRT